jgi:hypothetical protein
LCESVEQTADKLSHEWNDLDESGLKIDIWKVYGHACKSFGADECAKVCSGSLGDICRAVAKRRKIKLERWF